MFVSQATISSWSIAVNSSSGTPPSTDRLDPAGRLQSASAGAVSLTMSGDTEARLLDPTTDSMLRGASWSSRGPGERRAAILASHHPPWQTGIAGRHGVRRLRLFEFTDLPRYPRAFRRMQTDTRSSLPPAALDRRAWCPCWSRPCSMPERPRSSISALAAPAPGSACSGSSPMLDGPSASS